MIFLNNYKVNRFKNNEFEYPNDLEVRVFENFGVSLWNKPAPEEIPFEAPFPPIHIMVFYKEFAVNAVKAWVPDLQILRRERKNIENEEIEVIVGVVKPGPYYMDHVIHYTSIVKNNKVYLFHLDATQYQNVTDFYNQILSTFKFLEPVANSSPLPVACKMDAKICPDGTAVGKTGPKCKFAPCPTPIN